MSNFDTFNEQDEPATLLEPETILANRYRLLKQIGRGGMGVVWKAEEFKAGRLVVLKFVPHDLKNFESAVTQLKESFVKIHELQHQHICPVYTLEEDTSLGCYHVMKWLDGETLDEYVLRTVGRQKPLPLDEVLRILHPVAAALDYAHENRIVHRDIKPSNIFIVLDNEQKIRDVQVIDFGLASEIRSSMTRVSQKQFDTSGTRPYMAPEQWRGRPQSGSTDQYALAVMAYELLAGHMPFEGEDFQMLSNAVLNFPPEPIRDMPDHINAALVTALAKDSGERFESCTEFVQSLGGAEFFETKKPSPRPAARKAPQPAAPGVESLMKRGYLFLEDSDWKQANDYFDRVLDIDPEYAPAYVGLLCAELNIREEKQLGEQESPLTEYGHFKKAIRFADDEYRTKVERYEEKIRERIRQKEYERLVEEMNHTSNERECQDISGKFLKMNGYKDTLELAEECIARSAEIKRYKEEAEEKERERITEQKRNEEERHKEEDRKEQERIAKRKRLDEKRPKEQEPNEQNQTRHEQVQFSDRERRIEQERLQKYKFLCERSARASTEDEYRKLAEEFRRMGGYKDTTDLAIQYDGLAAVIIERREAQYKHLRDKATKASTDEDFKKLAEEFQAMGEYKNARELSDECKAKYLKIQSIRETLQVKGERRQSGLCEHCGGKLGMIFRRCKSCGQQN